MSKEGIDILFYTQPILYFTRSQLVSVNLKNNKQREAWKEVSQILLTEKEGFGLFRAVPLGGIDFLTERTQAKTLQIASLSKYAKDKGNVPKSSSLTLAEPFFSLIQEAPARLELQGTDNSFHTSAYMTQRVRTIAQLVSAKESLVSGIITVSEKRIYFVPYSDEFLVIKNGSSAYTVDITISPHVHFHLENDYKLLGPNDVLLVIKYQKQSPLPESRIKKKRFQNLFKSTKDKEIIQGENIESVEFVLKKVKSNKVCSIISQNASKVQQACLQEDLNLEMSHVESEVTSQQGLQLVELSNIIQPGFLSKLYKFLPAACRIQNLSLVFSTESHGRSMSTFYSCAHDHTKTLLIVKDEEGFIFGHFSTERWHVDNTYYGTGESFLFSLSPEFHVYNWTKANDFYQFGDKSYLCTGCGSANSLSSRNLRKSNPSFSRKNSESSSTASAVSGYYGLWLNLENGNSSTCETYLNRPLGSNNDFEIISLELWTFVAH